MLYLYIQERIQGEGNLFEIKSNFPLILTIRVFWPNYLLQLLLMNDHSQLYDDLKRTYETMWKKLDLLNWPY